MCCEPSGYTREEINGTCECCGEDTVDGDAYENCYYSSTDCEECGHSLCDDSC